MADPSVADLVRSFELHLRAENKAVRTIETYLDALRLAGRFLTARGVELEQAGREDIEAFIADQLARWKPATAANRYRSLRVFYGWLEAEGEISVSPMAKMRPPTVPDQPVPLVREDAFRRLLEASARRDFEARRDTALILLLVDVGPRRAEVAGMRLTDLDFDLQVALVLGKGSRQRALPFGRRTAQALDRYLRVRARHPDADLEWLWIGKFGRITESGIAQILRRRGRQAGLEGLHPHQLRHTFADHPPPSPDTSGPAGWLWAGGPGPGMDRCGGGAEGFAQRDLEPGRVQSRPARCRRAAGRRRGPGGAAGRRPGGRYPKTKAQATIASGLRGGAAKPRRSRRIGGAA